MSLSAVSPASAVMTQIIKVTTTYQLVDILPSFTTNHFDAIAITFSPTDAGNDERVIATTYTTEWVSEQIINITKTAVLPAPRIIDDTINHSNYSIEPAQKADIGNVFVRMKCWSMKNMWHFLKIVRWERRC